MTCMGTASLRLAIGVVLSLFVAAEWVSVTEAAKPTYQQAMKACRAKYGKKVINVIINKNGTLTCEYQVVREMTHAEAWALCRKKFGATQAFVQKKKGGWWCRYYGRY